MAKTKRILDITPEGKLAQQATYRDLYDIYDDLSDNNSSITMRTGYMWQDGSVLNSGQGGRKGDVTHERTADNFANGMEFKDSVLNYASKKKEVAATRRAGYTSASSVLGGGAL